MEIKGQLAVRFFNYGQDKFERPDDTHAENYQRVKGTWNVYYHGFMDRYDDIAYVKSPTTIEPGIYEIETYGVEAYLFFWQGGDRLRGLIVRKEDQAMIEDAYKKYLKGVEFL